VASVIHHEGRVLVTCDGRVPMVEVVEAASVSDASLAADYYWLLKVGRSVGSETNSVCVGDADTVLLLMSTFALAPPL